MIAKRGSRWRVVVQAGRDPLTGKRLQLSGSAATRREAVVLERELRDRVEYGQAADPRLADVVELWWASRPRLAPTTAVNYRGNLANHILPVLGTRRISELRPRLVLAFLNRLLADGMHPATVRKVRTVLSSVLSFAVAMEYLDSNPVMKVAPPEVGPTERVAPTLEETARILRAVEHDDPEFYVYLWVACEEGGRRGETLALRWRDVDFDAGTITIRGTISVGPDGVQHRPRTKTGESRTIAMSSVTLELLLEHRRRCEDRLTAAADQPTSVDADAFVFSGGEGSRRTLVDGRPWRPDSATRRFKRAKRRAGVRDGITLHGMRHTMITEMLGAGVDPRTVMGRAGHASEATTMQIYAKVRPAIDAAAAELWGRMLAERLAALREPSGGSGE